MILEYVVVILAFVAAAWTPGVERLPAAFPWAPGAAVASVLLSALLSFWTAGAVDRRMRSPGADWGKLVAFFGRSTLLLRLTVLALFAAAVHPGAYGAWVDRLLGAAALPGLREAVVLLPFLASWAGCAWALSAVEGGPGGAWPFVAFRLRGAGAILALLAAGGAAAEFLLARGSGEGLLAGRPWIRPLAVAAAFFASLSLLPFLLRALWPTRPLPDGDVRRALLEFGRKEGIRLLGIRLWDTGGTPVLNAAVAGLLPWTRTVFLTQALLEYLKPPEILAVFAHEAGHVKGKHAWGFAGLAAGWAGFASSAVGGWLDPGPGAPRWALQAGLAAAFVLLYLAYSRRAERAADLYAATALGDAEIVRETLGRVALLNGGVRSMRSLTHSSVASRIEFLARTAGAPGDRERFRLGLALWTGLIALLAALGLAAGATAYF
ncbi:MAG: M48 family metallopeptidase [Planctomycetes bacterium]|jgi:Zn-dependent protease with chaperone function|nr:M48 family metallopeptidase [Planctomycetota bacterium]